MTTDSELCMHLNEREATVTGFKSRLQVAPEFADSTAVLYGQL